MPLYCYTYLCKDEKCKHITEEYVESTEEKVPCEKCKGETVRTLHSFGFQLKGGGWYKDGYTKK